MSLVQELHEAHPSVPVEIVNAIATVEEWVALQRQRIEGAPVNSTGPLIASIQRAVAQHYGLSLNDLIGRRRSPVVAFPRMVAFHIARRLTTQSFPEIGQRFGRDHTTVLYGDRKITKMLETDASLQASVEMLIEQLGGERK
jgi:chromosomal replication initiation ATPase DnaA